MNEIIRGDMMSVFDSVDHFIICVGSKLESGTGELVMLNGLAGVLGLKYPTLKVKMGAWIKETCGDRGEFYLRVSGKVGILQHMHSPRNGVNLGLVSEALHRLKELALANPTKLYALEWPGYDSPEWMLNSLTLYTLPANVQVWKPVS
jgi:hypothetical protein